MSLLEKIKARSETLRRIRDFFYDREFLEVQTPTLLPDTMIDEYIEPIAVDVNGCSNQLFLQTSPEFAMKQLLLDGCEAIFEITPAFRDAEFGARHNAEFTMLEWYRVGDDYRSGMKLLADFSAIFFPDRQLEMLSYQDAFESKTGLNPHVASVSQLQASAQNLAIDAPDSTNELDRDAWLQLIMSSAIDSDLGKKCVTILYDWPASQCALAKLRNVEDEVADYQVAERFELYIDGIELANGYHELCDGNEQLRRLESNNAKRVKAGKQPLPIQNRLTSAMQSQPLPNCSGVALGIDRLLMLLFGKTSIAEV